MSAPGTPVDRAPDAVQVPEVGERGATRRVATRGAVVAVVVGAVSLFIGILGPVAIVLGLRARRRGAGWLAVLAIIAGSVSTGFLLLGIVHYLVAVLA
jgi:hypothetical protein